MQESLIDKMRLDLACVRLGLVESRNKAQSLIQKGKVCVNHQPCNKASYEVSSKDCITLLESLNFVSRAGEKLYYFLESNPNLVRDFGALRALDIGASTGGFSEVLLRAGVESIVCVDVGSNQLHKSLRENPRVQFYENMDIRSFVGLESQTFPLVVCDVSFIALKDILEAIESLASGLVILLFKPQFEVGIEAKRNKKGVLMESQSTMEALEKTLGLLKNNFKILCVQESKIKGKEGNVEFFIACQKSKSSA